MFLPFSSTTTAGELADSQLFGHRRGELHGRRAGPAWADSVGRRRYLFLDEIGDLPFDVSRSYCGFSNRARSPVGERRRRGWTCESWRRPTRISSSESQKASFERTCLIGSALIRIHVPPLRERSKEIPHLTCFFLREASDRLGKPEINSARAALDVLSQILVAGQREATESEIQRAVALSRAGQGHRPRAPLAGTCRRRPSGSTPSVSAPSAAVTPPRLPHWLQQSTASSGKSSRRRSTRAAEISRRRRVAWA